MKPLVSIKILYCKDAYETSDGSTKHCNFKSTVGGSNNLSTKTSELNISTKNYASNVYKLRYTMCKKTI